MKITGLILIVLGIIGAAISLIPMVQTNSPNDGVQQSTTEQARRPNSMVVPLAVSGVVSVAGVLMAIYGGKGYFISNNPRVRN